MPLFYLSPALTLKFLPSLGLRCSSSNWPQFSKTCSYFQSGKPKTNISYFSFWCKNMHTHRILTGTFNKGLKYNNAIKNHTHKCQCGLRGVRVGIQQLESIKIYSLLHKNNFLATACFIKEELNQCGARNNGQYQA